MSEPVRSVTSQETTTVRYVAQPLGRERENGPHLGDLRAFVEATADLPPETLVRIDRGYLSESGRCDVTFAATHRRNLAAAPTQTQEDENDG